VTGFPGAHEGRVAVVTGAAGGLGRAYAERLARDGAKVVVADVGDGAETGAAIEAAGGESLVVACDITDADAVERLRAAAVERFGPPDILVNNAGITPVAPWEEIDFELWRKVFAVNLDAMFLTCKAFTPAMRERGWGRIVNISSNSVDLGAPGFVHYMASKAGVIGLTRGLANELGADGVTANCILPGLTKVARTAAFFDGSPIVEHVIAAQAIKRPGLPADLEGVVSFLVSDDARWVTGQAIPVDGGHTRH